MQSNRFIVKFTNGFWKAFDSVEYTDVEKCFLKKEAIEVCKKLNSKESAE